MCDCVKKFDEALAKHNGRIAMAIQVTGAQNLTARICVATEKIDKAKKKPVPSVVANFCPFCGEKIAVSM